MTSLADWRPPRVRRQDWAWSSIRPVTLLIASGIVLVAAILVLTGLVAGHLREQALDAAQVEMGRLDAVVAAGAERSFAASDTVLKTLSGRLGRGETPFADGAMPAETAATLETGLGPISPFSAIAAFGPDGSLAEAAGWWPSGAVNLADRDFFARLRAQPLLDTAIGGGLVDSRNGATLIPFARRVRGETGDTLGYLVGLMPRSDLESFLRAVPLGPGSAIALTRQDGLMLASYPAEASLAAELEAVRPLPGYPLNIAIARNGGAALGEWSRQAALLGALALLGAIGVAVMVAMIARQFRIHAALAEVRAEKIEVERARLVTEAELLKKERLSVLGQLTATVAHELRNPLSAIRNTLFSVKEMASGAGLKLDRPISRMERSIERCNRIIADLLEYARKRELRRASVDFDTWLKEVLAEQQVPAAIALVEDFGASGRTVAIDGDRIRRVVINLIDNAAQALGEMPPDDGERRITVHTAADNETVELKVEDTGPGIAPENRAKIFEPLFSTKSFGTGLGLATVKQIVGQHGGTIDVDSTVGQGTCFTIRLPRAEEAKVAA